MADVRALAAVPTVVRMSDEPHLDMRGEVGEQRAIVSEQIACLREQIVLFEHQVEVLQGQIHVLQDQMQHMREMFAVFSAIYKKIASD